MTHIQLSIVAPAAQAVVATISLAAGHRESDARRVAVIGACGPVIGWRRGADGRQLPVRATTRRFRVVMPGVPAEPGDGAGWDALLASVRAVYGPEAYPVPGTAIPVVDREVDVTALDADGRRVTFRCMLTGIDAKARTMASLWGRCHILTVDGEDMDAVSRREEALHARALALPVQEQASRRQRKAAKADARRRDAEKAREARETSGRLEAVRANASGFTGSALAIAFSKAGQ